MTDDRQAERLAAWLDGAAEPELEALDVDVVEAVYALRPDLAPAPRVTADDILAAVTSGPLAAQGLPVGASEGAIPDTPQAPNRPWLLAVLGAGGASVALVAAAALLTTTLVLTTGRGGSEMELGPAAVSSAPRADGVALMDTGGPGGPAKSEGVRLEKPRRVARARPAPRPSPPAAVDPAPQAEPLGALGRGSGGGGSADGVAFADEDDVYDEEVAFTTGSRKRRQAIIPEASSARREAVISEGAPADDSVEAEAEASFGERDAEAKVAAPMASRPAAPAAPPPPPVKKEAAEERASSRAMAGADQAAPMEPVSSVPNALVRRAHRGVDDVDTPAIRTARTALAANDPTGARRAVQAALTDTTDPVVRQALYALLGDAEAARGDVPAAIAAYERADAIRQGR
jgi:hypothetical protein